MIDIRKLKELVRLMVENDLSELDLQDQQETVTIKRGSQVMVNGAAMGMAMPMAGPGMQHAAMMGAGMGAGIGGGASAGGGGGTAGSGAAPIDTSGLVTVKSPMVGTVFLAANPETPAFVQTGATVGPDSTVCLIEAMKVFSEIKAESSGTIERVLVSNGQAVEYGQALMLVRPQ